MGCESGDGAFMHECERHAIGQAPALVFAGAEQFKRGLEQRFRERSHLDLGIAVHLLLQLDRDAAPGRPRQCGTEFKLHRARSDEENAFSLDARRPFNRDCVKAVARRHRRDHIARVDKQRRARRWLRPWRDEIVVRSGEIGRRVDGELLRAVEKGVAGGV